MKWDSALRAMKNEKLVAREDWAGFWYIENGEIHISFYVDIDGTINKELTTIKLIDSKDLIGTLEHCGYNDWYVL